MIVCRDIINFSKFTEHVGTCSFLDDQYSNLEEKHSAKDRKEVRHDLKFSPCGKFLAVASNDNFVSDNEFHSMFLHLV